MAPKNKAETAAAARQAAARGGAASSADPGRRPTLKTIAEIANLGVTTVSRALKDGPEIGAETKKRVRRIASDIGYRPDRAGVRLRTGKTNVISLVLNPHEEVVGYGTSMIFGISQALRDTAYHLVVTPHFLQGDPMEPIRYIIETGSADGIILSRTRPQDERIRYLLEMGFPFICHGRSELATPHPFHDFDNYAFAFEAVKRLTQKGRRRLCIIAPPQGVTYHNHMMMGFERAAHQFGAAMVPARGIDTDTAPDEIRSAICAMMSQDNPPDGFVCSGDVSALALTAGLRDAGLTPGRDTDLVAKQTSPVLDHTTPAMDTIYEDLAATGQTLASLLVRRINDEPVEQLQSLREPELRFRTPCPPQAAKNS
ncbi:LacI family DNA-binding transcriptional regulator [Pelagibius litoralis]|uniref:LacI family DNA-binding transcriptional regulator n=1 Tax=Pelagibius litoralis TaxID=374515 RepID=A0A967EYQ9_9PROT|nr:LacI family transcriptional regulator [Pelagibius litoralis]NIA69819.1 LacI family DNA-binding transcriptional regulator [Pelagibius litoralis]